MAGCENTSIYNGNQQIALFVIPLAKRVDSDVLITVDQIPWFTAKLGQTKQKKAVRLNDIVNGDEVI